MVEFIQIVGFFICFGLLILTIILSKWKEGTEEEPSEPDNPLLLTIQAMEAELTELNENNIHMERIAQLEKDIKEAKAHAEALSKLSEEYGSTMDEVGESIAGGIGGRNAVYTVKPVNSNGVVVEGILSKGLVVEKPEKKIESIYENGSETDKKTRQNTAIYRTYTSQTGWSTYYDVKLK